jgi:hypothetical protein
MRTRFGIIAAFGVVLMTLLAAGLVSCKSAEAGVKVTVNNASGGQITNLQIKFTGGSRSAAKLKPSESFQTKVNPNGSSHLVVEFTDASGKQHSSNVDVYFERNYGGSIQVTIDPGGKVTWKDDVKV